MPFPPSLPERASLLDLFKAFPETSKPLIAFHERLGDQRAGVDDRPAAPQSCLADGEPRIRVRLLHGAFNDTMATELESSPIEAGRRFLAQKGWTVGKHAG